MSVMRDTRRFCAILAVTLALVLPHMPLLHWLCYPFVLLVTAIHEMSHALAGIMTGGYVTSIVVNGDGSGMTWVRGGYQPLIASAGYVGSTLFGCVLLVLAQRANWHRAILFALSAYFLLFTVLSRNLLAVTIGVTVLMALWYGFRSHADAATRFFVLDFIAFSSCLYAFNDFLTLISLSAHTQTVTDAQNLAHMTGIPALAWAVGWAIGSIGAACLFIRLAWRMTSTPDAPA